MLTFTNLKDKLLESAKDIKLNISSTFSEEGNDLNKNQIGGIALACAYTLNHRDVIQSILSEANYLSEQEINAAKSAATIMAMNNIYYRFIHLVNDKAFGALPARLRMNVIGNPGIDKIDFELYCLAVSAINGCGMCIEAHTHGLQKANVSNLAIQSSVRIASVLNALVAGLNISNNQG